MRRLVPVFILCIAAAPAFAQGAVDDAWCQALTGPTDKAESFTCRH